MEYSEDKVGNIYSYTHFYVSGLARLFLYYLYAVYA
jgi:hypothetical protein